MVALVGQKVSKAAGVASNRPRSTLGSPGHERMRSASSSPVSWPTYDSLTKLRRWWCRTQPPPSAQVTCMRGERGKLDGGIRFSGTPYTSAGIPCHAALGEDVYGWTSDANGQDIAARSDVRVRRRPNAGSDATWRTPRRGEPSADNPIVANFQAFARSAPARRRGALLRLRPDC